MSEIKLRLESGREAWEPAEEIEGTLRLDMGHDWTADYLELVLWWETSGRGDRDKGIAQRETFAEKGDRMPSRGVDRSFRIRLPRAPWTYHGRIIKIDWYVGAYARERGGQEISIMIPIRVYPGASKEPVAPNQHFIPKEAPPE